MPESDYFRRIQLAICTKYGLDTICLESHINAELDSKVHDAFEPEFEALAEAVQDELLAQAQVIETFGPAAGRPRVDTLNGSKHANMKELRFDADDGVWRAAFAFDPKREAIILVAADKSDGSEKKFYKRLIKIADERFDQHLDALKENKEG